MQCNAMHVLWCGAGERGAQVPESTRGGGAATGEDILYVDH